MGRAEVRWLIQNSEVFFESDAFVHDFLGNFGVTNVAEMPAFGAIAGDIDLSFGITEDKAIFGQELVNDTEELGFAHHIFVFVDEDAVFFEADVYGEAGMMFAEAGRGDSIFGVHEAILVFKTQPELFLSLYTAINAIEMDNDAFFATSGF